MTSEDQRRWCVFSAAGDNNAIRLWLKDVPARRWDLVVGYYGDDDREFSEISKLSSNAFRAKGGKYQILQKFAQQNPGFFDQYSYVWACDDDIQMTGAQIEEAFSISEDLGFWVAQPAFSPEGKNSHPITVYSGPDHDYRTVNFIENGVAIFRRCKLMQFLTVFDGSLAGWGIDYWYMNLFGAHKLRRSQAFLNAAPLGRFAVINRLQVLNPHDDSKGGREISRLQSNSQRRAAWLEAMATYGLSEFPHKVFASRSIPQEGPVGPAVTRLDLARQFISALFR